MAAKRVIADDIKPGHQIHRWHVLAEAPRGPHGGARFEVRCSCGTKTIMAPGQLRAKRSCGCAAGTGQKTKMAKRLGRLHGMQHFVDDDR